MNKKIRPKAEKDRLLIILFELINRLFVRLPPAEGGERKKKIFNCLSSNNHRCFPSHISVSSSSGKLFR